MKAKGRVKERAKAKVRASPEAKAGEKARGKGRERGSGQTLRIPGSGEPDQILEVVIPPAGNQILVLQRQVLLQEGDKSEGGLEIVQEPAGEAGFALLQALPDLLDQISLELVFQVKLGVPGELHRVG